MIKEALIKLQGRAEGSEIDIIDFTSIGKVELTDRIVSVEYDESEMSGMEGSVSKIVISGDLVTLNRIGEYVSTMSFIEGKETPADIVTPHGQVSLNIFTDKIHVSVTDTNIDLNLNYIFSISGERVRNTLKLSAQFM